MPRSIPSGVRKFAIRDHFVRGDAPLRTPIAGIAGCCARAASGQAAAPPPSSVMKSRHLE
jgi:hypothetical protein